jgi:hypothetical protein
MKENFALHSNISDLLIASKCTCEKFPLSHAIQIDGSTPNYSQTTTLA